MQAATIVRRTEHVIRFGYSANFLRVAFLADAQRGGRAAPHRSMPVVTGRRTSAENSRAGWAWRNRPGSRATISQSARSALMQMQPHLRILEPKRANHLRQHVTGLRVRRGDRQRAAVGLAQLRRGRRIFCISRKMLLAREMISSPAAVVRVSARPSRSNS